MNGKTYSSIKCYSLMCIKAAGNMAKSILGSFLQN